MAFTVVNTKGDGTNCPSVNTKGNVRIDYKKNGAEGINSVYTYDGKTKITSNNKQDTTLKMDNESYNILMDIVGSDLVLEQKDLDRIDSVANKYKNKFKLAKNLKEGEVTLTFANGNSMTIDFETNEEQKASDELLGYKAPYGPKKEYYRNDLIEKLKDSYQIEKYTCKSVKGHEYTIYTIKAKDDVNLAKLKSDLGIRNGIISEYNSGYGRYDYEGHFIDNKPMKDKSIKIPAGELGYEMDERNFFVRLYEAFVK